MHRLIVFQVSVAFLLCRDDLEVDYFLQQLQMLSSLQSTNHHSTMLLEWSRRQGGSCSAAVIESLTVAQCNHVIVKLGLDLSKLSLFYYPNRPEIVTHIHPVMKLLFLFCEKLTVSEADNLLAKIKGRHTTQLSTLDLSGPLELHLLHCISQKIFHVFSGEVTLAPLRDCLKEMDHLDLYDFLKSNIERYQTKPRIPVLVVRDEDSSSSSIKVEAPTKPLESSNDSYTIDKSNPGLLLIINQFSFHAEQQPELSYLLPARPLEPRKGTEKDVEALKQCFSRFKFEIIVKEDLTHTEILETINSVISTMDRSNSCLFVAILSHGLEGCVYGSNSIVLEIREIKNQILASAAHLLGKPKCLIVQACQGQDLQISRVLENSLQTDSPSLITRPLAIPPYSDFLIAWSTVEGFASLRHILTGTWFVQTLCEMINEQFEK